MSRWLPLAGLRAFECAARRLSFREAAAELGVTPTAISHQIRSLEAHCGQPLFRRRPRPLALTSTGERLLPAVRDGFDGMADALASIRVGATKGVLKVTSTNAFAARCLLPRLPQWRALHPRTRLDIIGTDAVLDLRSGEADVAIRYARTPPTEGPWTELGRDRFLVVGAPSLVGRSRRPLGAAALARLPLVGADWPPDDRDAPTWSRWEAVARRSHRNLPALSALLSFREELHAITAVIAGQGIGLCSDVLVARELADGTLLQLSDIVLPGYGFYAVHLPGHRKEPPIRTFTQWLRAAM